MTAFLGGNPLTSYTQAEVNAGRGMGAGDRFVDYMGREYIFLKASAAISAARFCALANDNSGAQHLTNAQNASGSRVGVASTDVASGDWGWFQVYGPVSIRVAASTTGGAKLYTTATAGVAGSTAASQDEIAGATLTTTSGGAESSANGFVNYPNVGTLT